MSGGGKGGGGGSSGVYDYYGSIVGVVGAGPIDELVAIIYDGKQVWPTLTKWTAGTSVSVGQIYWYNGRNWRVKTAHLTSNLNAPPASSWWEEYSLVRGSEDFVTLFLAVVGKCLFYWGTQTQTVPAILTAAGNDAFEHHPNYVGVAFIFFEDALAGRMRQSFGNVEVVWRKKPTQTLITGTPAILSGSGQANPFTAQAELLTSVRNGAGVPTASLAAFQTAANATQDRIDVTGCSILIDSQRTVASILSDISNLTDGWCRWNAAARQIEAGLWKHGEAPTTYHNLTIHDIRPPQFEAGSWADAYTQVVVKYRDRDLSYKETSVKVSDMRAYTILQEHRPLSIDRPWITNPGQAMAHGAETLRTVGRPQLSCRSLSVRREKGRNIRPGDWVRLDIDLEPGGTQLLQFFKVVERTIPQRGMIKLTLEADESLEPVPYTPSVTPSTVPIRDTVPLIPNARVFEASTVMSGGRNLVAVLAERPDKLVDGFGVWFSTATSYQPMGDQPFFAIRATLRANYADTATGDLQIAVPSQPDLSLLAEDPTENEVNDDTFLAVVFKITSGQIALDASGVPHWEVMSIDTFTLVSGGNYDLTVLRCRQGTICRSFTTADTEVWLIPRANLNYFTHADFAKIRSNAANGLTPDTAKFLLQPHNFMQARPLADLSPITFAFSTQSSSAPTIHMAAPTWATQDYAYASWNPSLSLPISGLVDDPDGDLSEVSVAVTSNGGAPVTLYRQVASGTMHDFSTVFVINSAGTHIITIEAVDKAGFVTRKELSINAQAVSAKLPGVLVNYGQPPGSSNPAQAYVAVGSTQQRARWDAYSYLFYIYADVQPSNSGAIMLAVTATSVTTAPSSGWSDLANFVVSGGQTRAWTTLNGNTTLRNAISSANPGAFKLWFKARRSGYTDSDPAWIIFS